MEPGSYVYGPGLFYFYAVEASGSRYLLAEPSTGQQWTRLLPPGIPAPLRDSARRYVIWPADERLAGPLPAPFACAEPVVATFVPPVHEAPTGPILGLSGLMPSTYERSVLREVPAGCGLP